MADRLIRLVCNPLLPRHPIYLARHPIYLARHPIYLARHPIYLARHPMYLGAVALRDGLRLL
jgi:hypothetical protein